MRLPVIAAGSIAATALSLPVLAFDMPETKVSMETCLSAVLAEVPGKVSVLKLEVEGGRPLYEFKIRTEDRATWELECDAMTGEIVDKSRTADRNDREFKAAAKIIERDARRIALERHPGKISASELEIADGRPLYEVEITTADGRELEVRVDAVTGEIVSTDIESEERTIYEIGG